MPQSNPIDYIHVVLVRHGQSVGNASEAYQGQSNSPLTSKGIQQIESLARALQPIEPGFDHLISSPLARARQTADILASAFKLEVEENSLWMERDAGKLTGLSREEVQARYPQPDFYSIYTPVGETGESQWQLYLRAGKAVDDLLQRGNGSYMIVSHAGLLNLVLYVMLGIIPQPNFYGAQFLFHNSGYAILNFFPETLNWRLENFTSR